MTQKSQNPGLWALLPAISMLACSAHTLLGEDIGGQGAGGQSGGARADGGQVNAGQASGGQPFSGNPGVSPPPVRTVYPSQCLDVASGLVETKILPPPESTGSFGQHITLDGDLLLATDRNFVHVYRHRGSSWERDDSVHFFTGTFGPSSLAQSGEWFAVGLPWGDSQAGELAPDAVNNSGRVSLYRLDGDGVEFEGELTREGLPADLLLGGMLAFDGTTLVVGSKADFSIYERRGSAFVEIQRLPQPELIGSGGYFGLTLKGDILLTGFWRRDRLDDPGDSLVSVFRRQGDEFVLLSTLEKGAVTESYDTTFAFGDDFLAVGGHRPVVLSPIPDFNQEVPLPIAANFSAVFADASTVAVASNDAFQLFRRTAGNWVTGPTLSPHDLPLGYSHLGPAALSGDRVAMGRPDDSSTTRMAGAVYVFEPIPGFVGPTCDEAGKPPAAIPGSGATCQNPGEQPLLCPFLEPGESTLSGATPYGNIALPFVYADNDEDSDGIRTTLVFSNLAPRGAGTRPLLFAPIVSPLDLRFELGVPRPFTFLLELCDDRVVEVEGTLTLDTATEGAERWEPPFDGEIHVDAEGWALDGRFHVNDVCGSLDTPD